MVVGLAGPMGAGKDALASVFYEAGFRVENLDAWGHQALDALKPNLRDLFGPGIFTPDGKVDRKALGTLVFASRPCLEKLNSLVHPWMKLQVVELLERDPGGLWVLNAAILHKLGLEEVCDRIVWVTAPLWTRIQRIRIRDRLDFGTAWRRVLSQRALSPKQFSRKPDILIKNKNGAVEKSRDLVRAALRQWMAP